MCLSVLSPVAGMLGWEPGVPPQLFTYLQTWVLQHLLEQFDSDLPAAASCSLLVGADLLQLLGPALEHLVLISEHLEALLHHFSENQAAQSFFQSLNLLQWFSWWGFQEVFLPVVWRCNLQTVHISIDSHCRGASQPEKIVSPRYSNILVWSSLIQ